MLHARDVSLVLLKGLSLALLKLGLALMLFMLSDHHDKLVLNSLVGGGAGLYHPWVSPNLFD
jgi:hypothetical protein